MASMLDACRANQGLPAKLTAGSRVGYDLSKVGAGASRGFSGKKKLEAAPWSGTWPAPGATLDLDFANNRGFVRGMGQGGVMDGITFTRASNATYVGEDGLLKGGGNALGKNLLAFPQDFDNAAWIKASATVVANATVAPDGTLTAEKLVANSGTVAPRIFQQGLPGQSSTGSIYLKAGEFQYAALSLYNGSTYAFAYVDLSNGTLIQDTTDGAVVSSVGDGWYRVTAPYSAFSTTFTVAPLDTSARTIIIGTGTSNIAGDGTSGIYIWGAQIELGSTATPYYPTNINVPRFDWASTENAQRNILARTEAPDFALNAVTNAGAYTGAMPIDASAAIQVRETATTAQHFFRLGRQNFVTVADGILTFTIRVLPQGRTRIQVLPERTGASEWAGSTFDLSDNTATHTITAGGQTLISSGVTDDVSGWKIVQVTYRPTNSITGLLFCLLDDAVSGASTAPSYAGDAAKGVAITGFQLEVGETATDYQAVAQPTASTPLRPAPTCNGLLIEEARTNRLLWCRDATQSNWVKTDITAAKDQTGIDGVANAASRLTATADGGTCIQTITLNSGSRTGSVYLKRLTGIGTVQVSLDGTTWSTVDLSDTEWRRIALRGTVTNPVVGVRIATSGDAVAMDFGQVEDGVSVSSAILTTSATATRSAEISQILQQQLRPIFKADVSTSAAEMSGTFLAEIVRGGYASGATTYQYLTLNNGGSATSYALISNRADNLGGAANAPVGLSLSPYVSRKVAVAFDIRNTQEESAIDGGSTQDKSLVRNATAAYDRLAILNDGRTGASVVPQGYIKRLAYFPQVMGASAMEALTL